MEDTLLLLNVKYTLLAWDAILDYALLRSARQHVDVTHMYVLTRGVGPSTSGDRSLMIDTLRKA